MKKVPKDRKTVLLCLLTRSYEEQSNVFVILPMMLLPRIIPFIAAVNRQFRVKCLEAMRDDST